MPKSRFQGVSCAAIVLAMGAAVAVIAGVAAWERSSVSVYEPTPTENLLLVRAGDVVDPSVELGATTFEERTEKRIEAFERGVLEYVFSAEETGIEVRTRIVERAREDLAQEELERIQQEFGGVVAEPFTGTVYLYASEAYGAPVPKIWQKGDRFLFLARMGTYVYAVETTDVFASELVVAEAMQSKMRELDRPGLVLPLRAPRIE